MECQTSSGPGATTRPFWSPTQTRARNTPGRLTFTVKRQTDKARYQVKVRPGQVTLGQKLSPSQLVTNLSSLPKKSKETSAFLTVTVNNPADSSRYTPVLLAAFLGDGRCDYR
ncbi:hypothetical protein [Lactobacillus delbrueckii]|uniref:hypothetical protein n=1 Tax=Lactobacillus delbrueckii TaxID=1584 RepID=UPI0011C710ED|nr:hypothetical protein [Lactobacillus delbrueckii]TXG04998.1 hypothetical protein FU323_08350 [Lactobacillus delbrueckii subsp. bulgaricus]